MTWLAAWEVVCDVGKAIYSIGLLAIGAQMLRAAPGMRRAMNALATASAQLAAAIMANAKDEAKLDQIAADVAEIKSARVADPSLLDRVYRALEQREAERRAQAEVP